MYYFKQWGAAIEMIKKMTAIAGLLLFFCSAVFAGTRYSISVSPKIPVWPNAYNVIWGGEISAMNELKAQKDGDNSIYIDCTASFFYGSAKVVEEKNGEYTNIFGYFRHKENIIDYTNSRLMTDVNAEFLSARLAAGPFICLGEIMGRKQYAGIKAGLSYEKEIIKGILSGYGETELGHYETLEFPLMLKYAGDIAEINGVMFFCNAQYEFIFTSGTNKNYSAVVSQFQLGIGAALWL
jgi:hypothetical protein